MDTRPVVTDTDLMAAIQDHPDKAAAALVAVQATAAGQNPPVTVDVLRAAAALLRREVSELWVEQLRTMEVRDAFVAALLARGVPLVTVATNGFLDHIPAERLLQFTGQAQSFRCRVLVDNRVVGSGCLIGPSLVLTAWHVIAVGPPGTPQEPSPSVQIQLADGSRQDVVIPPSFESLCGDDEFRELAPRHDQDVVGRNDVAALLMRRPAAAHLGHVRLPTAAVVPTPRSKLVLVHYPDGQDEGIGFGRTSEIPHVTARWRHSISTVGGSSGGACFDRNLEFAGLHQGRLRNGGRFVPLVRFLDDLRPGIAADVAPTRLWSLDGTVDGPLVIGRPLLFEALAAAGDDAGPVRGVRVKRIDLVSGGTASLRFTHDILGHLLERRGVDHTLVRLPFDELVADAVDDIRQRVTAAGLPLPALPPEPGVAPGTAAPEGTARDRAARLAAAVDAAAAATGRTVWFFLDNPSVTVTEDLRLVLDGFVAAALVQPRLRLVITGLETLPLPGQEFQAPGDAAAGGAPGLVVEFVGGFLRRDVLDLLALAAQDLTGLPVLRPVLDAIADRVLFGRAEFNGTYPEAELPAVAAELRADLAVLAQRGAR